MFASCEKRGLRRFVGDRGVVAVSIGVGFTVGPDFGFRLGAAARAFCQLAFDFLHRLGFRHMLDDGDFTRQAVECGFIELTFAVGLLGLRFRAVEIAHHFGDRHDVSGIDLGFVFLGPARPHRTFDARTALQRFQRLLHQRRLRQLAHADIGDLGGRHPQRHLVLHEIDHEQLKLGAGDLLLFDGQDLAIEEQEIAGAKLELFVINFMKDKMTLRVPTAKVANVGMRKLSEPALVKKALETLKGRARVKRTMWSRRAQEYEAKINSGDIVAIAEVVRDLFRSESQPEQSYSERQLYEAALDRLSREIAVVQHVTETEAVKKIKSPVARPGFLLSSSSEAYQLPAKSLNESFPRTRGPIRCGLSVKRGVRR